MGSAGVCWGLLNYAEVFSSRQLTNIFNFSQFCNRKSFLDKNVQLHGKLKYFFSKVSINDVTPLSN